jgi:hypothetical protein
MIAGNRAVSLRTTTEQVDPIAVRASDQGIAMRSAVRLQEREPFARRQEDSSSGCDLAPAATASSAKNRKGTLQGRRLLRSVPSIAGALLPVNFPSATANLTHRPRLRHGASSVTAPSRCGLSDRPAQHACLPGCHPGMAPRTQQWRTHQGCALPPIGKVPPHYAVHHVYALRCAPHKRVQPAHPAGRRSAALQPRSNRQAGRRVRALSPCDGSALVVLQRALNPRLPRRRQCRSRAAGGLQRRRRRPRQSDRTVPARGGGRRRRRAKCPLGGAHPSPRGRQRSAAAARQQPQHNWGWWA